LLRIETPTQPVRSLLLGCTISIIKVELVKLRSIPRLLLLDLLITMVRSLN
jgi:hypothetical protein